MACQWHHFYLKDVQVIYLARYCLTVAWLDSVTLLPLDRSRGRWTRGEADDDVSLFIRRLLESTTNFCPLSETSCKLNRFLCPLVPMTTPPLPLRLCIEVAPLYMYLVPLWELVNCRVLLTCLDTHCLFPCLVFSSWPTSRFRGWGLEAIFCPDQLHLEPEGVDWMLRLTLFATHCRLPCLVLSSCPESRRVGVVDFVLLPQLL